MGHFFSFFLLELFVGVLAQKRGERWKKEDLEEEDAKEGMGSYKNKRCDCR